MCLKKKTPAWTRDCKKAPKPDEEPALRSVKVRSDDDNDDEDDNDDDDYNNNDDDDDDNDDNNDAATSGKASKVP